MNIVVLTLMKINTCGNISARLLEAEACWINFNYHVSNSCFMEGLLLFVFSFLSAGVRLYYLSLQ